MSAILLAIFMAIAMNINMPEIMAAVTRFNQENER